MGGTIAQQVVRSIATSMADKAVAKAMDVDEKENGQSEPSVNAILLDNTPDPYRDQMLNMQFATITAQTEPLPAYPTQEEEIPSVILNTNPLVQVEIFNLLIGEEKTAELEKARLKGTLNLPQIADWKNWSVATGMVKSNHIKDQKMITFLIPPALGKLPSGSLTMVELSSSGDLNIARYSNQ